MYDFLQHSHVSNSNPTEFFKSNQPILSIGNVNLCPDVILPSIVTHCPSAFPRYEALYKIPNSYINLGPKNKFTLLSLNNDPYVLFVWSIPFVIYGRRRADPKLAIQYLPDGQKRNILLRVSCTWTFEIMWGFASLTFSRVQVFLSIILLSGSSGFVAGLCKIRSASECALTRIIIFIDEWVHCYWTDEQENINVRVTCNYCVLQAN